MRARCERGASALEVTGMVLVAALLVGVVLFALRDTAVGQKVACAVSSVTSPGTACSSGGGGGDGDTTASGDDEGTGGAGDADDGDRRDQEGQTRDNRRDDARGDRPEDSSDASDNEGGTEGGTTNPNGLGTGVPGTTPPPMPPPPAWTPPDGGAGEYASESPGLGDRAKVLAIEAAANALSGTWPDASRNLLHFLGNTGEPLTQDVDRMLSEVPAFQTEVDSQRDRVVASAIEQAQAAGATGPMTFPVNTPWRGHYLGDPKNWFYALGGISYNQTGHVTVTPPTTPGGSWTYTWSTQVNIRDRYNWDGSKSTQIGPLNVTDAELADLHRKGLAQEFTAVGSSTQTTTQGTVP